jgi:hypothetical protein
VLVLGREAWGFDALAADNKRMLPLAVEAGVSLVIFFQNFPKFDASWLPGGLGGSDSDCDSFTWSEAHPITEGVDPSRLQGKAVLNDALVGGEQWQNLTKPPGGLCIRRHGKGVIVFCQLEIAGRYQEPAAERLMRNILRFAGQGKKDPRVFLIDPSAGAVNSTFDKLKIRYGWIDDLPLKQPPK